MVRGISKQVIVVEGNNQDLYESAIFILKFDCDNEGINEKDLIRQAKNALFNGKSTKRKSALSNALWGLGGFATSCGIWLLIYLL